MGRYSVYHCLNRRCNQNPFAALVALEKVGIQLTRSKPSNIKIIKSVYITKVRFLALLRQA